MLMTIPSRAVMRLTFSLMNTRFGNVQCEHNECNISERLRLLTQPFKKEAPHRVNDGAYSNEINL
jgi:hypothetical protein